MKTPRHPPGNGFPRHLKDSRLFRKILRSQHAATTHDASGPSKSPRHHGASMYCAGGDPLNWMDPEEHKNISDQAVTEVEITPPPPYHEISQSRPAVRKVARFRTTTSDKTTDVRNVQPVTSLGSTSLCIPCTTSNCLTENLATVLMHLPPLPHDTRIQGSRLSARDPFSLDDMYLPRSVPNGNLSTYSPSRVPLRRSSSADNISSYEPTRPRTPVRYHRAAPLPSAPTRSSSLGSHPIRPQSNAAATKTAPSKPVLKRKDFSALIATGVMSPIHEEPEAPRGRSIANSSASCRGLEKRPSSILRRADSSDSVSPNRASKRVRFEDESMLEQFRKDRLYLFPTVIASLLLVLAISEVIDSLRLEYAVAFVVGCGIAHGGSTIVASTIGETLKRARAEGWA